MNPWPARFRALFRFFALTGHVAHERWDSRPAMQASDVPRSAHEITPQWLTAVLCKDIPGARVLDFHATGGTSGTSTRQGLQLQLNDAALAAGVPSRVFTKCTRRFNQRFMMGFSGMIHGEVGFYPHIRPQLDIEAPLGYYACLDAQSWRSMVIMEDVVASKGARFIATETLVTMEQMQDLLANMAHWHGRFWGSSQLSQQLRWLRTPADFLDTIAPLGFRWLCDIGLRRARTVVPSALQQQTDALWQALAASFALHRLSPPTFLHGDPHIGQTYVTRAGRMGYADWQLVMQGCWAFDVAYAIASALTIEQRRNWEQDLLRFYLDRLRAAGGPQLGIDHARLIYRQNMIYPYFCWLMTIAGPWIPLLPNMQPDSVALAIIERTAHAISDLESLKAVQS